MLADTTDRIVALDARLAGVDARPAVVAAGADSHGKPLWYDCLTGATDLVMEEAPLRS